MYSFRQKISGATVSVISMGVLLTPEGNAVAERPSLPGLAPVPPVWNGFTKFGVAPAAIRRPSERETVTGREDRRPTRQSFDTKVAVGDAAHVPA